MDTKFCDKCNGTGWLPVKEGNIVTRCECFKKQVKEELLTAAKIPKRYRHCELDDNFQLLMNNSLKKAFTEALVFAKAYPKVKSGLLFIGPCGVGKTHLAVGIINYLMREKGVSCLFYDFRDLLKEIRDTYNQGSEQSEQEILYPVLTKEILVLDELGSQNMSDWVSDMLMYVINQRYNENRITIFTTNYFDESVFKNKKSALSAKPKPKTDLDKAGEPTLSERIGIRLRSRLNEMCKIISITGEDYRQNKQDSY